MDSIVNRLEADRPLFHVDKAGNPISWNSNLKLLRSLDKHLTSGMYTIEIGAGYSTVVFLYKRCYHTCIVPSKDEENRIRVYCESINVSLDRIQFLIGDSRDLLPAVSKINCDIILIDGAHRFPFPIVDWFYCSHLLKQGGLILIDDTDIISCHFLLKFMLSDPQWEKVESRENFAIFRKLGDHDVHEDWVNQPFSRNKVHRVSDIIRTFLPSGTRLTNIKNDKKSSVSPPNIIASRDTCQLSVIINTFNRAGLLGMALESLIGQTLNNNDYEIIVIDDGSLDNTKEIVEAYSGRLPIKYFYQKNSGRSSAKNHGIYAARGKILLFLDDDDVATPTLLEEHIKFHRKYPGDNYAVLNYTGWSPNLRITPLMRYITDVGCFLFSYPHLKNEDILDYTYFWAGRLSVKRSFLIEYGVFNPTMVICEDIELGHRLSQYGLKVVYNSKAVSMANRPITFNDFCRRLIVRGRDQYTFSTLHDKAEVHKYTEVMGAEEKWDRIKHAFDKKIRSISELDKIANMKGEYGFGLDDLTRRLLHDSYFWAFRACKIKGIVEAKEDAKQKLDIESSPELIDYAPLNLQCKTNSSNPRNIGSHNKKGVFCSKPFKWFEVSGWNKDKGLVFMCCPSWLDKPIGQLQHQSVEEIWNGEEAQKIRRSILDGSFEYCNRVRCPFLQMQSGPVQKIDDIKDEDLLEVILQDLTILPYGPREVVCCYDRSCNLSCPSCRVELIVESKDHERILKIQEKIETEALNDAYLLHITGSGDPFGSPYFRKWLQTMKRENFPNLKHIHLQTNGLLWSEQMWNTIAPEIQELVKSAEISIDAATSETYSINRRGGNFHKLLRNLEFISTLRERGTLQFVSISMVVQENNFLEMPDFILLGRRFKIDIVGFNQIINWGTFGEEEFNKRAIHFPVHPRHLEFVDLLKKEIFEDPRVSLGNLTILRK